MPKEINFPDAEPRYIFDRDCLGFRAFADGKPLACMVTAELLYTRFGARDFTEEAMRRAYREHRPEIQAIARTHIENDWIDEQGRVFLTTRHSRLNVRFDDEVNNHPRGRELVEPAHRLLLGIIGPDAEKVDVEWGVIPGSAYPELHLRIADPDVPYSVEGLFGPGESADPTTFGVHLARLWGSILRARSRILTSRFG
jgi:hypothetical protein